jgi:hypothetical protein
MSATDHEQDDMWGPTGDCNLELALLLCDIYEDDWDERDKFWTSEIKKTIEREWDVQEYPSSADYLCSDQAAALRKLLVVDVECVRLAGKYVRLTEWLRKAALAVEYPRPENHDKVLQIRSRMEQCEARWRKVPKQLGAAQTRLN